MAEVGVGSPRQAILVAVSFPIGEAHTRGGALVTCLVPAHVAVDEDGIGDSSGGSQDNLEGVGLREKDR